MGLPKRIKYTEVRKHPIQKIEYRKVSCIKNLLTQPTSQFFTK